jgi:hypothetical protein
MLFGKKQWQKDKLSKIAFFQKAMAKCFFQKSNGKKVSF